MIKCLDSFYGSKSKESPDLGRIINESHSNDQKVIKELTRRIPFGGGTVNDVYSHMLNFSLPFGGRNSSGIGSYRGKKSFEEFSLQKSLLTKGFGFDAKMKYPPYRDIHKLVRKVIPWIKL